MKNFFKSVSYDLYKNGETPDNIGTYNTKESIFTGRQSVNLYFMGENTFRVHSLTYNWQRLLCLRLMTY